MTTDRLVETDRTADSYLESSRYGAMRELAAMNLFMAQGFTVSSAIGNPRYDFIAEKNGRILRVQVKNLKPVKDKTKHGSSLEKWEVHAYSKPPHRDKRPYTADDCDLVVAISLKPEESATIDEFAVIPIGVLADRTTPFPLSPHESSMGREYLHSLAALETYGHK